MIRELIQLHVAAAVERLIASDALPSGLDVPVEIVDPKDPSHGDFATSWALAAAKPSGKNPRELAEMLAAELGNNPLPPAPEGGGEGVGGHGVADNLLPPTPSSSGAGGGGASLFSAIEVAGPGFLNFRVADEAWLAAVDWANARAENLAKPKRAGASRPRPGAGGPPAFHPFTPLRLNVEFVSVNPNGPITVGSGRGAAFGSTLCNVLEAAGHSVHREYYINDGTNSEQMRLFMESVESFVHGSPFPENGYRGDYVEEIANALIAQGTPTGFPPKTANYTFPEEGVGWGGGVGPDWLRQWCEQQMLVRQRDALRIFDVTFDTWFSEQSLHDSGKVAKAIEHLQQNGSADEKPERRKLKLAKGGVVEDVIVEEQPVEEDEAGEPANDDQSTIHNPQSTSGTTLWLRSTKFGDDMDRVLRRKDGRLTYIASDVAYHKDKFERGSRPDASGKCERADKLITILGPDHHGYIGRLHAVLAAMEVQASGARHPASGKKPEALSEIEAKLFASPEDRDACRAALAKARDELEVLIFQIVRFVKEGKPAPMRKRDGNIYSLRDLMAEIGKDAAPDKSPEEQMAVGKDVARFFYLMRSHDTHMDFDIDLATKGTEENPVFYVQYAHARICSILEKAGLHPPTPSSFSAEAKNKEGEALHPKESALIKKILDLPEEVARCAQDYGVHRLTTYAIELARSFHHFYDACRVLQPENPELQARRLAICEATRHALRGALELLGISAPEKM